jgi:hypothetical protein
LILAKFIPIGLTLPAALQGNVGLEDVASRYSLFLFSFSTVALAVILIIPVKLNFSLASSIVFSSARAIKPNKAFLFLSIVSLSSILISYSWNFIYVLSVSPFNRSFGASYQFSYPLGLDSIFIFLAAPGYCIVIIGYVYLFLGLKKDFKVNALLHLSSLSMCLYSAVVMSRTTVFPLLLIVLCEIIFITFGSSVILANHGIAKKLKKINIFAIAFLAFFVGAFRAFVGYFNYVDLDSRSILFWSNIFGEALNLYVGSSLIQNSSFDLTSLSIFKSVSLGIMPPYVSSLLLADSNFSAGFWALAQDQFLKASYNITGYAFTPASFGLNGFLPVILISIVFFIPVFIVWRFRYKFLTSPVFLIFLGTYLYSFPGFFRWDPTLPVWLPFKSMYAFLFVSLLL